MKLKKIILYSDEVLRPPFPPEEWACYDYYGLEVQPLPYRTP